MRLRPTARGSTLRDTASPSLAGESLRSQCRLMRGSALRRPSAKTRSKSAPMRTRALRGRPASTGFVTLTRTRAAAKADASDSQATATLRATTREDLAAVGGLHARTEAVVALALEVAGLVSALGGHDSTRERVFGRKEAGVYGVSRGRSTSARNRNEDARAADDRTCGAGVRW